MKKAVSVLLVITMVFCMAACGSDNGGGSEAEEEVKVLTPEEVVAAGLDAFINCDADAVQEYFLLEDDADDMGDVLESAEVEDEADDAEESEDSEEAEDDFDDEMARVIFSHMSYKITGSEISGDTATVTVDITNKNAGIALGNAFLVALNYAFSGASDEETNAAVTQTFIETFESDETESVTNTVVINLKMVDGKWLADASSEGFLNAVTGGMVAATEELSED